MICLCAKFVPNVKLINMAISVAQIHGASGYTGDQFVFCPWCGKPLIEEKQEGSQNG